MSDQISNLMGQGSPLTQGSSIVPVSPAMSAASSAGSSMTSGFSSPTTLGVMQAGTSVLQGLSQMQEYQSKAYSDRIQAGEWGTQAKDEFVMGQGQVSGLKSQYLSDIGGLTAKAGAGGVDVGQGVTANARNIIGQNVTTAQQATMLASDIRARRDTINQIQANAAADEAQQAGNIAGVGGVAMAALNLAMLML